MRLRELALATARSWFHLTRQERLAVMIVLGIFMLGAITRWILQ